MKKCPERECTPLLKWAAIGNDIQDLQFIMGVSVVWFENQVVKMGFFETLTSPM